MRLTCRTVQAADPSAPVFLLVLALHLSPRSVANQAEVGLWGRLRQRQQPDQER